MSGIRGTRQPSGLLRPRVGPRHDAPDERRLCLRVGVAIVHARIASRQLCLELAVLPSGVRMDAHEIADEQRELLAKAPGTPHVKVRATLSGWLAKVALGPFSIAGAEDIAYLLQRQPIRVKRLEVSDGNLDVDHRFGRESRHGSGPDVIDAQGGIAKCVAEGQSLLSTDRCGRTPIDASNQFCPNGACSARGIKGARGRSRAALDVPCQRAIP